jgi:ribosome-associated protein
MGSLGLHRSFYRKGRQVEVLQITGTVNIPLAEIEITAIRAPGPGGQHVNKVSSAIHLRFDIGASSLPEQFKERLLLLGDHRITGDGVVVIKASRFRSLVKNREDSLSRLQELVKSISVAPRKRKPTNPSRSSKKKRMDSKSKRGKLKNMRGRVKNND